MTDKQIIIDGIDVSGCKYYLFREKQPKGERCCGIGLVDCNNNDCLYKKYKRKEQKLEKIKKIVNTHKRDECVTCSEFDNCLGHPYCDEVILKIIEE